MIASDEPVDIILHDIDVYITPFQKKILEDDQSFFFYMKRKLYASPTYIKEYGDPKDIDDLKNHRLVIMDTINPFVFNMEWILTLGMEEGKLMTPVFRTSSFEALVEFVSDGLGIMSCYDEFDLLEKQNLVHIVPGVVGMTINVDLLSPRYLKDDEEVTKFIEYLRKKITKTTG